MEVRESSTPVREFRTTAVSSVATIQAVNIPKCVDGFTIYAPTNAYNLQIAPRLVFCGKTADSGSTFTDYTSEATDGSTDTSVILSSLDTAANGDYWYLAAHFKFAGATLDIDGANGNASVMTGYYHNGTEWTNATITDGTDNGGACLGQDGNITWTVPTDWATVTLNGISGLYVMRFQVSAALDASTTVDTVGLLSGVAGAVMVAATTYVFGVDTEINGALNIDEAGATSQTIRVNWINQRQPLGL